MYSFMIIIYNKHQDNLILYLQKKKDEEERNIIKVMAIFSLIISCIVFSIDYILLLVIILTFIGTAFYYF
jgi:hypothetical protein